MVVVAVGTVHPIDEEKKGALTDREIETGIDNPTGLSILAVVPGGEVPPTATKIP
jgi:hypothetical protein